MVHNEYLPSWAAIGDWPMRIVSPTSIAPRLLTPAVICVLSFEIDSLHFAKLLPTTLGDNAIDMGRGSRSRELRCFGRVTEGGR